MKYYTSKGFVEKKDETLNDKTKKQSAAILFLSLALALALAPVPAVKSLLYPRLPSRL